MDGGADACGERRHDEQDGNEWEHGSRVEGIVGSEAHNHCLDETCRQRRTQRKAKRRRLIPSGTATVVCTLLASGLRTAMAQSCISLADSTACSAFNASSISTNSNLTGLFPFLSDVTDTASFDSGIQDYIANGYTRTK